MHALSAARDWHGVHLTGQRAPDPFLLIPHAWFLTPACFSDVLGTPGIMICGGGDNVTVGTGRDSYPKRIRTSRFFQGDYVVGGMYSHLGTPVSGLIVAGGW